MAPRLVETSSEPDNHRARNTFSINPEINGDQVPRRRRRSLPIEIRYGSYRVVDTIRQTTEFRTPANVDAFNFGRTRRRNHRHHQRNDVSSENVWFGISFILTFLLIMMLFLTYSMQHLNSEKNTFQRNHLYVAERVLNQRAQFANTHSRESYESRAVRRRYFNFKKRPGLQKPPWLSKT